MKTKRFSVEISDEAEVDLENSYQYYAEESQNLAESFFKQISSGLEVVKKNPGSFPFAYKDVRKFVVKKFPFVIYYQLNESVIRVIAIFHTSRNPEIWNERI
jgi:toxin ParE1/3/4